MQVDPVLTARVQRLKPKCDIPLSNDALNFSLRPHSEVLLGGNIPRPLGVRRPSGRPWWDSSAGAFVAIDKLTHYAIVE